MSAIALLIIASVWRLCIGLYSHKLLRRYWDRRCTGVLRKRRFPEANKSEIRAFLDVFADAFGFRKKRRLCFAPDDKVMEVYRALYPTWATSDCLELATLIMQLEDRYKVNVTSFWREDITLGEILAQTRSRKD